ncbi:hypothetical protein HK102_008123 [Quaeritorhiza haematococci]|nr:hypothetical protein HK102_008123 [Quaeritorhiza haematococci]
MDSFFKNLAGEAEKAKGHVRSFFDSIINKDEGSSQQSSSHPSSPQNAHPYDGQDVVGPFLRFVNLDLDRNVWHASVLVITKSFGAPQLILNDNGTESTFHAYKLDSFEGHNFFRYDIHVAQGHSEQKVTYRLKNVKNEYRYEVTIPGYEQKWRWAFFSCNDFDPWTVKESPKYGGHEPTWRDLLKRHSEERFHAMVGGGDQIYCDGVWSEVAELKPWTELEDRAVRLSYKFEAQTKLKVHEWYFNNYRQHFSKPVLKDALATIPYVFCFDDHDIWNGYGSYPEDLQKCPMFQGVAEAAFRFYFLFQHHTTHERANTKDNYFGKAGSSFIRHFGKDVALLGVDGRMERTRDQIVSKESYELIFERLQKLPRTVKHLVVLVGIPIIYPHLGATHAIMGVMEDLNEGSSAGFFTSLLKATKLDDDLLNEFGEVILTDDVKDHWCNPSHLPERKVFITRLQNLAQSRSIRISFISGDVHLCAAGRLFSNARDSKDPAKDHRYMVQIVSSAIVNAAPSDSVVKGLMAQTSEEYEFDEHTTEMMIPLFTVDVKGEEKPESNRKLYNRRNYATCKMDPASGQLLFDIRVENDPYTNDTRPYRVEVPPLNLH